MHHSVWEFYESVRGIDARRNIHGLLTHQTEELGFEQYAFFSFHPGQPPELVCSEGLPLGSYLKQRAFTVDPILHRAEENVTPISWNTSRWDQPLCRQEHAVLAQLRDLAIECGVSVPVHGPGLEFSVLCLSTRERERLDLRIRGEFEGALLLLGAYITSLHRKETRLAGSPSLSSRQIECLSWTAQGKTAWEIGRILSISERTVRFHLGNAMMALDVVSKHQAVLKAIALGLLRY